MKKNINGRIICRTTQIKVKSLAEKIWSGKWKTLGALGNAWKIVGRVI